jgi:hypothetical protein
MHQVGRDDGQLQVFGSVDSVFRAIQTQNVGESLRGIAVGEVRVVASPVATLLSGCPNPAFLLLLRVSLGNERGKRVTCADVGRAHSTTTLPFSVCCCTMRSACMLVGPQILKR